MCDSQGKECRPNEYIEKKNIEKKAVSNTPCTHSNSTRFAYGILHAAKGETHYTLSLVLAHTLSYVNRYDSI